MTEKDIQDALNLIHYIERHHLGMPNSQTILRASELLKKALNSMGVKC